MMNNELRPYSEIKDSHYEWLGVVPNHWKLAKAKRLFKETSVKNHPKEELLSATQNKGVIPRRLLQSRVVMPMGNFETFKLVNEGNFVISLRSFQGGLEYSKYRGIVSPAYNVMEENAGQNRMYYKYLMKSKMFISELQRNVTGIRQGKNIDVNDFKEIVLPIPSLPEQDQIVKYLDYKLAKINKLLKAKKKQIELLRELIEKLTVTAINNPSTQRKRFFSVVDNVGKEINRADNETYTPIGLFNRGRGIFHKPTVYGVELGDSNFFEVEEDVLIFSGQFAWEGAVALSSKKDEGCVASHRYPMVRGKTNVILSSYLWAFFLTKLGNDLLNFYSRGAAGRNRPLNIWYLLKEKIPVPSMEEQIEINLVVEKYNLLNRSLSDYIRLISEYKDRIISDVVTGKVDTRNISINQIEEIELEELEINNEVPEEMLAIEEGDE